MSETVQANDGAQLPLNSLPLQIQYSGSFVSRLSTSYAGKNYQQTFEHDGTNIIFISGWENTAITPSNQVMIDQSGNIMVDQNGDIMITQ
jgi:hypothetical protein